MKQELSVLIPTYNGDCRALVTELHHQAEDIDGLRYEMIVADDGSTDRRFVDLCREVEQLSNCRFIDRGVNSGRAAIRNFLAHEARFQWLLFLDCDMAIPSCHFLSDYLSSDVTDIAYGGYVVGPGDNSNLRYRYEKACEPQHRADERRRHPFLHFHTCNFLVRRDLMLAHPFDERFRHYGYEDVLFGKQIQAAGVSIIHIDNPAGFLVFEDNAHFVSKTEEGLRTLHTFRDDLRGYSNMLTFVEGCSPLLRFLVRLWHRLAGPIERRLLCGHHPTLRLFKLYKLGYFLSLSNKPSTNYNL